MKEVTKWDNNPREMWVWDNDSALKKRVRVVYMCDFVKLAYPVVALSEGLTEGSMCLNVFKHCAEIEKPKTRRMAEKYNEILRLKDMLESAKIPFKFSELHGGYHIVYMTDRDKCICSVIEHDFSYGREKDLLEIKGLLTELEKETLEDDVLGYLTAEEVFQRIKNHWEVEE